MDIVICGMKCISDKAGCSKVTLAKWIEEDGFPAFKKDGVWRAVPEDVQEWFRDQCKKARKGT